MSTEKIYWRDLEIGDAICYPAKIQNPSFVLMYSNDTIAIWYSVKDESVQIDPSIKNECRKILDDSWCYVGW